MSNPITKNAGNMLEERAIVVQPQAAGGRGYEAEQHHGPWHERLCVGRRLVFSGCCISKVLVFRENI